MCDMTRQKMKKIIPRGPSIIQTPTKPCLDVKWGNPDCWSFTWNYLFFCFKDSRWGSRNWMKPTQKSTWTITTLSEMHQWLWTILRGIWGTQNCWGQNLNAHCKENKKSVSQSRSNPSKKKTLLGPRQRDRLK